MSNVDGRILGGYRLCEKIGQGGMGEVYRAEHLQLGREAVIKLLPSNLATAGDFLQRFKREAASAAALQHPNIVQIFDYGEQEGVPYIVMPYIRGGTLQERLERGGATPTQLVPYLIQIAEALDFAHARGIVHRDVKPANILIDEHDKAYLADFGVAKALEGTEGLTQAGHGVGTPEYMAPEQAQGNPGPSSDTYALGIMVYQILTGRIPYRGNSTVEVLMKHMQEPLPLEPLNGINPAFAPVLQRALAKNPTERYASAQELMQSVNAVLAGGGAAFAPTGGGATMAFPSVSASGNYSTPNASASGNYGPSSQPGMSSSPNSRPDAALVPPWQQGPTSSGPFMANVVPAPAPQRSIFGGVSLVFIGVMLAVCGLPMLCLVGCVALTR